MSDDRIEIILRRQRSISAHGLMALAFVVCCAVALAALLLAGWNPVSPEPVRRCPRACAA